MALSGGINQLSFKFYWGSIPVFSALSARKTSFKIFIHFKGQYQKFRVWQCLLKLQGKSLTMEHLFQLNKIGLIMFISSKLDYWNRHCLFLCSRTGVGKFVLSFSVLSLKFKASMKHCNFKSDWIECLSVEYGQG